MFIDIGDKYPAGRYIVLYDGEGTITFGNSATKVSETPGRIEVDVVANGAGILLRIAAVNPANYIKNIRMLMPGYETAYTTTTFHPLFVERIKEFKSLRFMDWQKTNGSTLSNWSQRPTKSTFSQSSSRGLKGVALEYMIELANSLHADPWFNIPHMADDDFVTQFATMVRDNLDPSLKIYVEYSNEIWNSQFPQSLYAKEQGLALGLSTLPTMAGLRYQSQRSVEIFNIWEQVFGAEMQSRVVRVMATQASSTWTTSTLLDWNNAYLKTDALATAPYFGVRFGQPGQTETELAAMSVDELLDLIVAERLPETDEFNKSQFSAINSKVNSYGKTLEMIAYEGGQHLVTVGSYSNNQAIVDLFIAANRHARMKDVYTQYLNQWKAAGGKMFMHFSSIGVYKKNGSFGMMEYQTQDPATAPKYSALMDFIANNPTFVER